MQEKAKELDGLAHEWQVPFVFLLMDMTFQAIHVSKDGNKIFETQPSHLIMESGQQKQT
jgi:hypothetical protein